MTIATTSTVLLEGTPRVVMQFTGLSDGPSQETDVLKVDPKLMTPKPRALLVQRIIYDIAGGALVIGWDAYEGTIPFMILTGCMTVDYREFGSIVNLAGTDTKGGIVFSTVGFDAGSSYSVLLDIVKKY